MAPADAAPGLTVPFQGKKPPAIGVKAAFPGFVAPALASSIDKVPTGNRWIPEIKFDGYKCAHSVVLDVGPRSDVVRLFNLEHSPSGLWAPRRRGFFLNPPATGLGDFA
jgi:hypothetical protein